MVIMSQLSLKQQVIQNQMILLGPEGGPGGMGGPMGPMGGMGGGMLSPMAGINPLMML